jgi:F0F1-type ATP synthase assembly protein I
MIKNLLEQDERQPEEIKTGREEKAADESAGGEVAEPQYIEVNEAENPFYDREAIFDKTNDSERRLSEEEIESINSFVESTTEASDFLELRYFNQSEGVSAETPPETIDSEPPAQMTSETLNFVPFAETRNETASFELPAESKFEETKTGNAGTLFQPRDVEPESFAETARKSGLAYAAAITLFASIVFMLIIGWFADLLFGSSPWGIVGGIIFGSLIGFVQFFRMTAQIFKNKD